ncbi:expressed unknown protein [Seminavis robusta]|uniref:Uncharacterized protein n=1 Tax=Seminavis robusta TaxID=568900 RepID=A0A9N8ELB9_9STRA|nr:expressed unknown protein [Seminavis robusta]|eukprot:Sro1469_g275300.1 n/a (367) ;mRNA; f:5163-6263
MSMTTLSMKQRFRLGLLGFLFMIAIGQLYKQGVNLTLRAQLFRTDNGNGKNCANSSATSDSTSSSTTSPATQQQLEEEDPTYTLVVVHCKVNMTWLDQVPSDWRIVVYEKCGQDALQDTHQFPNTVVKQHRPINAGPEECNGYFDYMHDYYNDLTTVNVFVHDDALLPFSRYKREEAHTMFETFEPIVNVTQQFVTPQQPFVHLGGRELQEQWGMDNYDGYAMKILWPYFAIPNNNTTTTNNKKLTLPAPPFKVTFKPSAHFAVHKQEILKRPQSTYWAMLQQMRFANSITDSNRGDPYPDARKLCCAMERTLHLFFGQPAILPKRAMATDLLNMTECFLCNIYATVNEDHARDQQQQRKLLLQQQ